MSWIIHSDHPTLRREWVELDTGITRDQRIRETEVRDISIAYMSSGLTEVKLYNKGEFVKDLVTPYSGGSLGQTVIIRTMSFGGSPDTDTETTTSDEADFILPVFVVIPLIIVKKYNNFHE